MANLDVQTFKMKNGQNLTLRSPKVGEGQPLLDTVRQIMAHSEHLLTQADEFNVTVEQEESMIARYLDHTAKLLVVPEVDGKIVGMMDFSCGGRRRNSHTGEFGMSLLPDFRGQGIGTRMLEALLKWAAAHPEIEKVCLHVHRRNEAALNLYKKAGFVIEGTDTDGVKLDDGSYDDALFMTKFVR